MQENRGRSYAMQNPDIEDTAIIGSSLTGFIWKTDIGGMFLVCCERQGLQTAFQWIIEAKYSRTM